MMTSHIIARIVAFVVWVEQKTFNTVMTVECALTRNSTQTTTARVENTSPTVLCVKSSYSAHEVHHMKCHVDMPYIGIVSDNWLPMTLGVQCARKLLKLERG